jgi:hypothetical protein
VANSVSNLLYGTSELTLNRLVEATVNTIVRNPNSAQWGELKYLYKSFFRGAVVGLRNARLGWAAEMAVLERQIGTEPNELAKMQKMEQRVAIGGKAGRLVRMLGYRHLLFADELYKGAVWTMHVSALAYRRAKAAGLKGQAIDAYIDAAVSDPLSDVAIEAMDYSEELAFQGEPGKIESAFHRLKRNLPGARWFIPFIGTPAKIGRTALRKSPLGSIALSTRLIRKALQRAGVSQPGFNYSADKAVRHLSEQMIGWGATMALMAMAWNDDEDGLAITGSSSWTPFGSGKSEAAASAMSRPPLSIRINGVWYSYARLEYLATAIGVTVDLLNSVRRAANGQEAAANLEKTYRQVVGNFKDKTFMKGISDLIAVSEEPRDLGRWASDFTVSWIPNIIRQPARATDPYVRDLGTTGEGRDFWTQLAGDLPYKALPIAALAPPPKVDALGRPVLKSKSPWETPETDFLFRLLSPTQTKQYDDDDAAKIARMIVNWNTQHPDDVFPLGVPTRSYTVKGERRRMTDEQYNAFLTAAGERVVARFGPRMTEDRAANPTKRDMEKLAERIVEARKRARRRVTRSRAEE